MVCVTFSAGSRLSYRVGSLELPGHVHQIRTDFEDGSHVFTSADFRLDTVHSIGGKALVDRLSYAYTYDAANAIITLCGSDFLSANSMALSATPEGTNHVCIKQAAPLSRLQRLPGLRIVNYRTQLMRGAEQDLQSIVSGAKDGLISALEASSNLTAVQIRKSFPSLPAEHYLNICVVYRSGRFLELFDHAKQCKPDDEVHSVCFSSAAR